jgi:hypothetical protein
MYAYQSNAVMKVLLDNGADVGATTVSNQQLGVRRARARVVGCLRAALV